MLKIIKIKTSYITLGQFIKFAGISSSGVEAKNFINNNEVMVNDELEKRRGRKLYFKDKIKINNFEYLIEGENNE